MRVFRLLPSAGGAGAEVLDKAREDEAQGILVEPDWSGSMRAREIEYCEQLELVARWRLLVEWPAWFDLPGVAGVRCAGVQNEVLDDVDSFCTFSFHPESLGGA